MNKLYMGLDIGSVSAKGVIIDEYNNIISSSYLYTEGNPIKACKQVIRNMRKNINLENDVVVSVGTTGFARKLIGTMLSASVIKNEITAEVMGTISLYPDVKTIFEIGGEDSKIILINDGTILDYEINNLCSSGTGAFIDSLSKRLNIRIEDISDIALRSKKKINLASRCMIFAEVDLIHKIGTGYEREDVIAAVCNGIAINYINNVCKGKKILSPIVFNGGVSKNMAIVKELENCIHEKIIVNKNSQFMGAIGIAIMARDSKIERKFDFNIDNYSLETKMVCCNKCANNCEIVNVYKNNDLIDHWGNRCNKVDAINV